MVYCFSTFVCLKIFFISFFIYSSTHWLFSSLLLNLYISVDFPVFFFHVINFQFHTIVFGKNAWYDFNPLKFKTCFVIKQCDLSWKTFHMQWKRMCILLLLDGMSCKYLLSLSFLICCLRLMFPYWFSLSMICPLT